MPAALGGILVAQPEPVESQEPVLTIDQRFRAVRTNRAGVQEYVLEAPRL
jgi:hypothetical protein